MATTKTLSKRDLTGLLDLIYESLSCSTKEELVHLIKKLGTLLPTDYAASVFRRKGIISGKEEYEFLNIAYPKEWVQLYFSRNYHLIDPIIKNNFNRFTPQYWVDTYKQSPPPKDFLETAEVFGLKKGYTHGIRNFMGTEGSLFSFSGPYIDRAKRTEVILTYLVPHLHQAFARVTGPLSTEKSTRLTDREREVLKWTSQGKSSWDISTILGISERTINFHVKSIMKKLDAVNRTHAVAIALEQGLIDIG